MVYQHPFIWIAAALLISIIVFAWIRKKRDLRQTTITVFHATRAYKKILDLDIPLMARDGMLLGAVRHHGFIPFDNDPDVMIAEEDFERLMNANLSPYHVKFCSSNTRPNTHNRFPFTDGFSVRVRDWPHKVLDGTILLKDEERSVKAGEVVYALGYKLYGRKETEFFYTAYGHAQDEDPMYYMKKRDIFPLRRQPFYEGFVYIPNNSEKLLEEHFGRDVFQKMFNKKTGKTVALGPMPCTPKRLDMKLLKRLEADQ